MAVPLPRVFFVPSSYVSHRQAGHGYKSLLEDLGCLTDRLDTAHVVLLHLEAPNIAAQLAQVPAFGDKYLVNYCVWETSKLPQTYLRGLRLVDEVWTASSFCAGILHKDGIAPYWLPHVVERPKRASAAARAQIRAWLGDDPARFDVLNVTKMLDPRKDTATLSAAFAALQRHCPHARLVFKVGSTKTTPGVELRRNGHEVWLFGALDDDTMRALHEHCQLVASSSHAEGWGLTLSFAMAHRMPLIAPAYSGQLTFMTAANSLLVPAVEGPINTPWGLFSCDARWGYVLRGGLEQALIAAWQHHDSPEGAATIACARRDIRRFDKRHVRVLLAAHLRRIARRLAHGFVAPDRVPTAAHSAADGRHKTPQND